jgi:hypothetical protein
MRTRQQTNPEVGANMKSQAQWAAILLFVQLPVLLGCSGMIKKYGMDSYEPFEASKSGYYEIPASMSASGPYSGINFEGVSKVKGISVNPRIYKDSTFLSYARDVEAYFEAGSDSAIIFYRNYVTSCCDGYAVGSFFIFLGYEQGSISPSRSFMTESGSISPPHYTWWPRKIIEKDSSYYIEAYQNPTDTVKPYWFEIYHSRITETGLEKFSQSKRRLRNLIKENTNLVRQ